MTTSNNTNSQSVSLSKKLAGYGHYKLSIIIQENEDQHELQLSLTTSDMRLTDRLNSEDEEVVIAATIEAIENVIDSEGLLYQSVTHSYHARFGNCYQVNW